MPLSLSLISPLSLSLDPLKKACWAGSLFSLSEKWKRKKEEACSSSLLKQEEETDGKGMETMLLYTCFLPAYHQTTSLSSGGFSGVGRRGKLCLHLLLSTKIKKSSPTLSLPIKTVDQLMKEEQT